MNRDAKLIEAAIEFDLRRLQESRDAGALHFVGVLQFHPAHIGYKSPLSQQLRETVTIDVDERSTLFQSAEVIRLMLNGQLDDAGSLLAGIDADGAIDGLFLTLMAAWCFPDIDRFSEVDQTIMQNAQLSKVFRARIYIKLMTWAMTSGGRSLAAPYYEKALEAASGDLAKALAMIGEAFDRESKIYFKPIRQRLVAYPWILELVRSESRELIVQEAKNQIISPFTRTFSSDVSPLPRGIRAAELQAGWTGAYWILENIWRTKGAILLTRAKDRSEIADGIAAWAYSRGPTLDEFVGHYEHMLTPTITEKMLLSDLLAGERISSGDWQELCSGMWDQLPASIALQFIRSLDIPDANLGENSYPVRERVVVFFNNLALVDRKGWSERFDNLPPDSRLAVVSMMPRAVATSLPAKKKSQVRRLLLNAAEEHGLSGISGGFATNTLAALIAELGPSSKERLTFMRLIEREFAAEIALQYPDLLRADLVALDLEQCISSIRAQLIENQQGRWGRHSRSPLLRAAQCMIAVRKGNHDAISAIIEVTRSQYSSSDDVIDAVRALNWLAEEKLLPSLAFSDGPVTYRAKSSPADIFWQGRNDLRAMNTVIAGLLSKYPGTSRESIDNLVASARDPDTEIRLLAMEQLSSSRIVLSGRRSAVDAAILGGIYDPESLVQAQAIRLIDRISNDQIHKLAWARILNDWRTAHRRVRIAAANSAVSAKNAEREPRMTHDILRMAADDRSVIVRRAAKPIVD